ncbi:MAG TPA: DUF1684 domain-containing protein [Usitatibacteraceae bacterium]|nr:DUF1684 domain-containing protein [Usitatibacteraceae bacterium]
MRILALALVLLAACATPATVDTAWETSITEWRARAEKSLRADNGWLTLAGRFVMKPGANTFGTGAANDIVFPKGLGPERMGTITIAGGKVRLAMAPGLTVRKEGMDLDEVVLGTDLERRDWVSLGRAAMHVIEREGRYVLRLADNESEVRKGFGARLWYAPDASYRVNATFVAYPPGRKLTIINVLDEASDEASPGYVEFTLAGKTHRLDAVGDDEGLFFVLRDATAGDTTYRPGRFLYVAKKPEPGKSFELDLNRVYNPPCAFSEYTTCPLPPKQNILKVRLEAGEKYPPRRAG